MIRTFALALILGLASAACAMLHDGVSDLTGTTLGERCAAYRAANAAAVAAGLSGEEEATAKALLDAGCPVNP